MGHCYLRYHSEEKDKSFIYVFNMEFSDTEFVLREPYDRHNPKLWSEKIKHL